MDGETTSKITSRLRQRLADCDGRIMALTITTLTTETAFTEVSLTASTSFSEVGLTASTDFDLAGNKWEESAELTAGSWDAMLQFNWEDLE